MIRQVAPKITNLEQRHEGFAEISASPLFFIVSDKRQIRTNRLLPKGSDYFDLVGMVGLEPMTSCMSSMRSNQLSYTPATACISYHFPSPLVNQIRGRFRFFCPFGEFCRRRPAAAGRRPSPARRPQRRRKRQKRRKRQTRPAKAGRAGRFFYSGGRIRLNTMPLMRMIAMHTGAM